MAPNRAIAIAGAGIADYIETAISKLTNPYFEADSLANVREIIENRLLSFFDNHLSRWSAFSEQERPTVELLIAVGVKEGCQLLHYSGTALHPVEMKAIGAGVLLADNLMLQYYSPYHTLEQLASELLYIMYTVKQRVDTCGGFTNLVMMKADGMVRYLNAERIARLEESFAVIDRESAKTLLAKIHSLGLPAEEWHNREMIIAKSELSQQEKSPG